MSTDPEILAERVVKHMLANDPFSRWLGVKILSTRPGKTSLSMTIRPEMLNGFNRCHGGVTFALADSAFAFASNSHGRIAVSIENSMSYPHPVVAGDELTAVAEEVSLAHRVGFYDVTVTKSDATVVGLFRGVVYRTDKEHFPEEG